MLAIGSDRTDPDTPLTDAPSRIRVALATHAHVHAQGLGQLLHASVELEVAGIAISRVELLRIIEEQAPDVALVDFGMRDAPDTARTLARSVRGLRVVGYNIGTDDADIAAAAAAGLAGYVLRDASVQDLVEIVSAASRNLLVCSPRVAAILNARLTALMHPETAQSAALTPRELEVAQLIDQGYSNKQIARRLSLRVSTVKNHVHSILDKLSVERRGQVPTLLPEAASARLLHAAAPDPLHVDASAALTPRERQIAAMIDRALTNQEIAEHLNLRLSTVKNHVHSILEKLRVERRGQAAAVLRRGPADARTPSHV